MIVKERHFKMDSSLASSEIVVSSVRSQVGKVGSLLYSRDKDYNAKGIKRVSKMSSRS